MKKIVSADPAVLPPIELTDTSGASEPAIILPPYWDDACKHLVKKDRVMKRLIPQFGNTCLQSRGDAFSTLARSIVGQQISVKAAQTVWNRFVALPLEMTPAHVLRLKIDDMRAAGLSARKVEYLVDLSIHFDAGRVHVRDWQAVLGLQDLLQPTTEDVQRAYRRLAGQHHSDRPGGDHDKMVELNTARAEALDWVKACIATGNGGEA